MIFNTQEFIYLIRILLAGVCGIIVGLERKNRSKEAGIRTHFVVAAGAAIIMVVSKYAFFDVAGIADSVGFSGEIRLDPSRVASTIASGIGFLGAGMIFVHKNTVTGLTTAAGIWATSGIGMAIGSGLYIIGIGATLLILLAQLLLHLDFHRSRNSRMRLLIVKDVAEDGYQALLTDKLKTLNIEIQSSVVDITENGKNYVFTIELPKTANEEDVISLTQYKSSIKPLA